MSAARATGSVEGPSAHRGLHYPEWAGYLAAFDAFNEARRNRDDEAATQARRVMGYFASELIPEEYGQSERHGVGRHPSTPDLKSLAELLGYG